MVMGDAQWGNANAIQHIREMIALGQLRVTTFALGVGSALMICVYAINFILGSIALNRDALMIVEAKGIAFVVSVCVNLVLRVPHAKQILSGLCGVQRSDVRFLAPTVASGE